MSKMNRFETGGAGGPALPIVPMLDMAFQIFAFFVFTYHPSGLEGQMELNLPSGPTANPNTPPDPKAMADKEIKALPEVTVILHTHLGGTSVGEISHIEVQQPQGRTQIPDQKALLTHLTKIRTTLTNGEDIKIEADQRVRWEFIIEAMDVCKKAKFQNIGFGPPPDRT